MLPNNRPAALFRRVGARPLTITRRSTLTSALHYLVEAAKMNGVDPHAHLNAALEAIAAGRPVSRMDELLPWAYTPTSS